MRPQSDPRIDKARNQVRVSIACQQQDLEEKHASGPDGWASTKPGQDRLANQWLNLEQKKRADEYRSGENPGAIKRHLDS